MIWNDKKLHHMRQVQTTTNPFSPPDGCTLDVLSAMADLPSQQILPDLWTSSWSTILMVTRAWQVVSGNTWDFVSDGSRQVPDLEFKGENFRSSLHLLYLVVVVYALLLKALSKLCLDFLFRGENPSFVLCDLIPCRRRSCTVSCWRATVGEPSR